VSATVRVYLHSLFRLKAAARFAEIALTPGAVLIDLVRDLVERYPVLGPLWLDGDGRLQRHVLVFIDGSDAAVKLSGLQAEVPPGCRVDIFPPTAGG
jgi:molybdopterin converting factor small subunit